MNEETVTATVTFKVQWKLPTIVTWQRVGVVLYKINMLKKRKDFGISTFFLSVGVFRDNAREDRGCFLQRR